MFETVFRGANTFQTSWLLDFIPESYAPCLIFFMLIDSLESLDVYSSYSVATVGCCHSHRGMNDERGCNDEGELLVTKPVPCIHRLNTRLHESFEKVAKQTFDA